MKNLTLNKTKIKALLMLGIGAILLLTAQSGWSQTLSESLLSLDKSERMKAQRTLKDLAVWRIREEVPQIVMGLTHKNEKVRSYASEALQIIGPEAGPIVITQLRENPWATDYAAPVLRGMGLSAVQPLSEMATDSDHDIRFAALRILSGMEKSCANSISLSNIGIGINDPNEDIRVLAAESLGVLGCGRDALNPLIFALNDPSVQVQEAAASALGRMGENADAAVSAIKNAMMRTEQPITQYAGASALISIGTLNAVDALKELGMSRRRVIEYTEKDRPLKVHERKKETAQK